MTYENKHNWTLSENKPNSNPISQKPKMNANAFSQKDYENKTVFRLEQNKPKQSQWIQKFRIYFAIFGLWPRSSVKWPTKTVSISISVFSCDSAISFRLARQFAAVCVRLILSGKLASQSLQISPLAELLK